MDAAIDAANGKLFSCDDETCVALIKSLATHNRFYALVARDSDIHNADTVEGVPHELLLGIAYPCIEDGLNDFAIIHTAYETLERFSDDEDLQAEMTDIINETRRSLTRRLMELLERFIAHKAYFLGTDLETFKERALDLMKRGCSRHSLDNVMKVNVFSSVAATEQELGAGGGRGPYRYTFFNSETEARLSQLTGREFLVSLFSDVLDSVLDERNYESKYTFDRNIFQQFIALMFILHAATDPVFYGTHRDDYGVSRDKDMENTPLYRAIGHELRRIAHT
jgi:hypothetical protein